jgi:hypothetical protein
LFDFSHWCKKVNHLFKGILILYDALFLSYKDFKLAPRVCELLEKSCCCCCAMYFMAHCWFRKFISRWIFVICLNSLAEKTAYSPARPVTTCSTQKLLYGASTSGAAAVSHFLSLLQLWCVYSLSTAAQYASARYTLCRSAFRAQGIFRVSVSFYKVLLYNSRSLILYLSMRILDYYNIMHRSVKLYTQLKKRKMFLLENL